MRRHPYDEAADREVARFPGARVVERDLTGRKRRLVVEFGGARRCVFYPHTPGDRFRGPARHACDVRRVLQEVGATPD